MARDDAAPSPFRAIPHAKKRAFLAAYAATGNISRAAEIAHVDRGSHYDWHAAPGADGDVYRAAFAAAGDMAADALEAEARRRAIEGVTKPVYQQGRQVGAVQEYSDTLLIFLLKGALPSKYKERHEHSGQIAVPPRADLSRLSVEELEQYERLLAKAAAQPG